MRTSRCCRMPERTLHRLLCAAVLSGQAQRRGNKDAAVLPLYHR